MMTKEQLKAKLREALQRVQLAKADLREAAGDGDSPLASDIDDLIPEFVELEDKIRDTLRLAG
jgi:hypothetical protein